MAEKLVFDDVTTGTNNNIKRATKLARKMICEWGMSDELGPLAYGTKEEQIFLGREITRHRDYSEETSRRIDAVVKQIILDANERVTQLLTEHRAALNAIAEALLDKETIVLDDMIRIVHEVEHPGEPWEPKQTAQAAEGPVQAGKPVRVEAKPGSMNRAEANAPDAGIAGDAANGEEEELLP